MKLQSKTPQFIPIEDEAGIIRFIEIRDNIPASQKPFITPYTLTEYRSMRAKLYLAENEKAGYGIKPDGELISIFALPGSFLGPLAIESAIANGATNLECFAGHLEEGYKLFGFSEYNRVAWDQRYASPDWNYGKFGRPDIVLMKLVKKMK